MKILILGGFLGSGKTTVLMQLARHIVDRSASEPGTDDTRQKVVILENEVGEAGIDDKFLRSGGFRVEELFSGCACCTVSGQLVDAVHRIRTEFAPEWLIVETTGLAYPGLIRENLHKGLGLGCRVCIIVDASRWNRLLRPMHNLLSGQIIGSEIVLVNKSDLVDAAVLDKIEADIAGFDKTPQILRISALGPVSDEVWMKVLGE
jgi:G3E family GTPase